MITLETIQTYKGHRPDRTVVFEKRDLSANGSINDITQSNRTLKSELSKDFSSMTLSTPNEDPSNSTISTNKVISKNKYNGVKDSNNNPTYGTPTLSLKNGRNSISYRGQSEDRMSKSTSNLIRHSTPSPVTRRSLFSQFETDCLIAHNNYRSLHNVPHLKLNKKLCRYAEEWAKVNIYS